MIDEMLKNIDDRYDKSTGSFFYDALKPVAIELEHMDRKIKLVESKLDVENLEGLELETFVQQRTGIRRKPATKANGPVKITGQQGTTISIGDLVASDSVNYRITENKTISPEGNVEVNVESEDYGAIGNVPVGAIRYIPISIAGLTGVTNLEIISNGYEAESDRELRDRYYEKIRTPATSGNIYHYLNWAKEVTGVGGARVLPLWAGDNTVKIIIINSNKEPASPDLVKNVQDYIDPDSAGLGDGQAPIGAFCTVVSADAKEINISVKITRDTNYSLAQTKNNIQENIKEYLKTIAFADDIASYAKIGAIILESAGVLDYENLKINGGTANISILGSEVATIGVVTVNE